MAGSIRLSKLARECNVGIHTIVDFLQKKGFEISSNPNTKIVPEAVHLLEQEYKVDILLKKESEKISLKSQRPKKEVISIEGEEEKEAEPTTQEEAVKEEKRVEPVAEKTEINDIAEEKTTVKKPKIVDKIDLENIGKPKKKITPPAEEEKQKEEKLPVAEEKPEEKIKPVPDPVPESEPEPTPKKTPEPEVEMPETGKDEKIKKIETVETEIPKVEEVKVVGKINLADINQKTRPDKKSKAEKEKERRERFKKKTANKEAQQASKNKEEKKDEIYHTKTSKINGPTVLGKIDLPEKKEGEGNSSGRKKRRKRINKDTGRVSVGNQQGGNAPKSGKFNVKKQGKKKRPLKKEVNEEDVQKQIKDTLARLTSKGKSKGAKHRREKRAAVNEKMQADMEAQMQERNVLKVTEFVTVAELANMMDVGVNQIISSCMALGLFVSINQRLDAETLTLVAEEFGYKVEFVSVHIQEAIEEDEDQDEDLKPRSPIVTVMGHVDHGKTSLLDYIRHTNVIAGEAGGITQHIGAYHVKMKNGKDITFLDTPGHEAFTAMRARGAQVTDVAIIIVAADDDVMPQTIEAINHASAAGVPIVFAINKIDKPGANPEKIKEGLANMNYLVEEWGGKFQSQDISAKNGIGIEELMEKVLLEAEMLELKANPDKHASGAIIESELDKGRGYVSTVLVESGSLKIGDVMLAGQYFGHVKAMFNERNQRIEEVGPAQPAIVLGLNGAPQAGDKFNVMESEREARNISNKREQLAREQGLRTQKHITLDEIGRRIAIGNFQELNLIIKGDVDGSIEALSDSLIKLSTEEIQVNVKHKAVGQISESDILLAAASEAIVIGFQVRPSLNARKLAEKEQIDIRLYSIIYDAINEIKAAMEGMLSPEIKEEVTGTAEIQEVFKISKVGTIAGCIIRDGKVSRNSKVRVIRDGIVIYSGELGSLKRFKEDVKEVKSGYECGLNIENFNDIKVGDHVEAYHEVEVAKKL